MRKKILWVAAALVLIAIPAVIGLVTLREDNSRRAGALVVPGAGPAAQLQLTQAQPGTAEIKDAIVVDDFSFGVENPTTIGSATGGAGAGKIKFNEFHDQEDVRQCLACALQAGGHRRSLQEGRPDAPKAGRREAVHDVHVRDGVHHEDRLERAGR